MGLIEHSNLMKSAHGDVLHMHIVLAYTFMRHVGVALKGLE